MLEFLAYKIVGVRLWIWLYMLLGLSFLAGVFIYFYRERIKEAYYKIRYPEKTIKIIIHYHANIYKVFWRIIPLNLIFDISKQGYFFDPKNINRLPNIFAKIGKDEKDIKTVIDGKEYRIDNNYYIERKNARFPEIHYLYNNPSPLSFDPVAIGEQLNQKETKIKGKDGKVQDVPLTPSLTSKELKEFEERDMFGKLLQLKAEKSMMLILILLVIVNLIMSILIGAKVFDLIKAKGG